MNHSIDPSEVILEQAMADLSSADRDLILSRYYEDRELDEIAGIQGVSSNTVAKRLSRALQRLRRRFAEAGTPISSVALAEALSRALHESAPPALAQVAVAAATAGVPPAIETIVTGVIHTMIRIKAKLVAATVGLVVLGVGGGLLSVTALMAQSSALPAQSAKSPATQPAEALDPKAVLLQFADAIKRNDAQAVRSLVHAEGQDPQQILELACDYVITSGDFKAAIKEKFGAETLARMSRGMNLSPIDQFAIFVDRVADQLELAIDGDEATLKAPEISSDVFYMVRHDGRWKLSADRMTESWSPDAWEQRTAQVRFASGAIRNFTENIQNGQYATPADLQRDIQTLLNQGR